MNHVDQLRKFSDWQQDVTIRHGLRAAADALERTETKLDSARKALKRIATEHQSYAGDGEHYGIGVTDGHRCAAKWAREALSDK